MSALAHRLQGQGSDLAHVFDIDGAKGHLHTVDGGYEIVHESARLEVGIYGLVAPEPDRELAHSNETVYVVLEGSGMLDVGGEHIALREGHAAFIPAGVSHCFSAYEQLSVVVISGKSATDASRGTS